MLLFLLIMSFIAQNTDAQSSENTLKYDVNTMVNRAADSLKHYYVDLKMGEKIGEYLKAQLKSGVFNNLSQPDSLAKRMTRELRSVNGDLHLYVLHKPKDDTSKNKAKVEKRKSLNYGIVELKILEENIGYIKVKSFSNWDYYHETRSMITSAMKFLEDTNTIIFDVRDNGGGVPQLVAFMISYLYPPQRVHLAQYTHRYNNSGYGLYTEENIPGKRLPNIPVFVLVNEKSGSAAEEFAYFLKHRKRATIVGKTTMGAGYGTMWHRLNDEFIISISSEEDINPITGTNFEKVGVIPHVKTKEHQTLPKAIELAKETAKNYKRVKQDLHKQLLLEYENISSITEIAKIEDIVLKCQEEALINLNDINGLGYQFLQNNSKISEAVFRINTQLYPSYSNAYDSYGDALTMNNKLIEAQKNYKKAIELGEMERSRYLPIYRENLKKVEKLLKEKAER